VGWPTSGTGARRGRRPARTRASRTWSPAATCRSCGRNS
jgi:hypothetical protein